MSDSEGILEFESADEGEDLGDIIVPQVSETFTSVIKSKIPPLHLEPEILVESSESKILRDISFPKNAEKKNNKGKEEKKETSYDVKENKNKYRQEKVDQVVKKVDEKHTSPKIKNKRKNKKRSLNSIPKDEKKEIIVKTESDQLETEKLKHKILDELLFEKNETIKGQSTEVTIQHDENTDSHIIKNIIKEDISSPNTKSEMVDITESIDTDESERCDRSIREASSSLNCGDFKDTEEYKPMQDINEKELTGEESKVLDKLADIVGKGSGWGWGTWGASLLSTATSSVTTFTSQVGQGFASVLETVEDTLGAPSPEQLAAAYEESQKTSDNVDLPTNELEDKAVTEENSMSSKIPLPGADILLSGMTNLTSVIQNTSKHLVTGSLDALETIGKKTMDILQEGDPGFKKKRALFQGGHSDLSQTLREAKQKAEIETLLEEEQQENKKAHFGLIFDNFQGLAHLEALEMLSSQSDSKLKATTSKITGEKLTAINNIIEKLSETCSLEEIEENIDETTDHEFCELITEAVNSLNLRTSPEKIILVQKKARRWLEECKSDQDEGQAKEAKDIHEHGINSLAELTARAIEQFHKSSELLLLQSETSSHMQQAASLTKLTNVICKEIGILSEKYVGCLNTAADDSPEPDSVIPFITDMYLEASNSSTYIQDAFQLTIPVLQLSAMTSLC